LAHNPACLSSPTANLVEWHLGVPLAKPAPVASVPAAPFLAIPELEEPVPLASLLLPDLRVFSTVAQGVHAVQLPTGLSEDITRERLRDLYPRCEPLEPLEEIPAFDALAIIEEEAPPPEEEPTHLEELIMLPLPSMDAQPSGDGLARQLLACAEAAPGRSESSSRENANQDPHQHAVLLLRAIGAPFAAMPAEPAPPGGFSGLDALMLDDDDEELVSNGAMRRDSTAVFELESPVLTDGAGESDIVRTALRSRLAELRGMQADSPPPPQLQPVDVASTVPGGDDARLLRAGLRPLVGRLTCIFANLAAFRQFDPAQPTASRFVDEDLNRVWDREVLDGPRVSAELTRARTLRPLIDTVDILLDLHSMLWPSDPLMLCGTTAKGRALATRIGVPGLIIADSGHGTGRRLMDYGPFADPEAPAIANLIEAGQHWQASTVATTEAAVRALLHETGLMPVPGHITVRSRAAEVTHTVSATTSGFAFVRQFRGGEIIPERNTLIAVDGTAEIRTPYDDCLLVMPSLRPSRGHTAVRLGRVV
jgi:hypothetical protein